MACWISSEDGTATANSEEDRWRPICADEGRYVVVDDGEEEAEVSGGWPDWVLWEGVVAR